MIFTGEYYLLNALWFGMALIIIGVLMPKMWVAVRFVIIMCLPFGLVAFARFIADVTHATRDAMRDGDTGGGDVVPIDKKRNTK